jgi:hypothetical protein
MKTETQTTITLAVKDNQWHATFSEGPDADEMRRLFGTNCIPTAFVSRCRADVVQREIQALNPYCRVVVEGGAQ